MVVTRKIDGLTDGLTKCLFVFISRNFKQFHFLLQHGFVCVKGSHRANNGKQRTRLPGDLPFTKTRSRKCQIVTLEACYHNDQAEKRKISVISVISARFFNQ